MFIFLDSILYQSQVIIQAIFCNIAFIIKDLLL